MVQLHAWSAMHFGMMFAMWAVMMVGMMLPSATPTTLVYAAVARKAERDGQSVASTSVFVAGYLTMWTLFSLGATLAQWALEAAALLSPMMVSTSPLLGGALLVVAGLYQFTPLKEACLEHCRSPAHFIAESWRPGTGGAFRMGIEHGAFCLGCCWVLMLLLFVGGVMNLLVDRGDHAVRPAREGSSGRSARGPLRGIRIDRRRRLVPGERLTYPERLRGRPEPALASRRAPHPPSRRTSRAPSREASGRAPTASRPPPRSRAG